MPNVMVSLKGQKRRAVNNAAQKESRLKAKNATKVVDGEDSDEEAKPKPVATRRTQRKRKKTLKAQEEQEELSPIPQALSKSRPTPKGKISVQSTMQTTELEVPISSNNSSIRGRAYTVFT